jgi:hypothetical protein
VSQILTRNMLLSFNFEALTDQGYLQSPYRKIRYQSSGGVGFTLADQIYPGTRTSSAASALVKYYLPYRAAITASYRFFNDSWGIQAHTGEVGYTHPWRQWIFDGSFRYYRQTSADFYSDLYTRPNEFNFMARDRELAQFQSYTFGLGASYDFRIPGTPSWIGKSTASFRFDHIMIDYDNFRNALLTDPANGVFAGAEPLYKLNANVFQLFVSIWF